MPHPGDRIPARGLRLRGMMLLALVCGVPASEIVLAQPVPAVAATDVSRIAGLPEIGKWSIGADGLPAHWLGELYRGKGLREPINVILMDTISKNSDEAKARVTAAAKQAGYAVREGHSAGYQAYIGTARFGQLPTGTDYAFSNAPFEVSNNHGRLFGPLWLDGAWLFTGAFSREQVAPLSTPKHRYESFNVARDDFTQRLDQASPFKIERFVDLGNAVVGSSSLTTGDHDGIAVMLVARAP